VLELVQKKATASDVPGGGMSRDSHISRHPVRVSDVIRKDRFASSKRSARFLCVRTLCVLTRARRNSAHPKLRARRDRIRFASLDAGKSAPSTTCADVFREKLLAALLKLCNAAENFLRAELKNLANDSRSALKGFFESLGSPSDERFAAGSSDGRIVRPDRTGAVLASLTFDGG
jgi:hypothetical protein